MKLLDVNLLLYAVNTASPHHQPAKAWLERAFSGSESVGLAWVVILAFLRLSSNAHVFAHPLSTKQAVDLVDEWLALPSVHVVHSGAEHWRYLRSILIDADITGNLTTDAHLAALAIEGGYHLISTDQDFRRFKNLRFTNPLTSLVSDNLIK